MRPWTPAERKKKERQSVLPIISFLNYDESCYDWSSEKPDCRLTTPDGTIGIEVVRCYNDGNKVLQMRALVERACQMCKIQLERQGFSNKFISVHFSDYLLRTPPEVKTHIFYKAVIEEIERHLNYDHYLNFPEYITKREEYLRLNSSGIFNYQYVESISEEDKHLGTLEVDQINIYFTPHIEISAIQKCINKKNLKLKAYRNNPFNKIINDYWLFIVIEWESFTDLGELPPLRFNTDYSHIYICDSEKVKCLK